MRRTSFVLLLLLLATLRVNSASVEIDGIYYNLNDENKTAEVTNCGLSVGIIKTNDGITFPKVLKNRVNPYQGNITIPSQITKNDIFYTVTSIGDWAFIYSGITSITIPESVISIAESAFYGCTDLTSITVQEGNTTYDSRNNCNAIIKTGINILVVGCNNTIIPNSVTSINNNAFAGCSGLTSITIPDSVMSIGEGAFAGCSGLTSITIPDSVMSIGEGSFAGCSGLTSITIPDSVMSIGESTFAGCSGLTSISIPDSVMSIGNHAFAGCSSLASISIPESVTSIGASAFYGCSSLTSITIPDGVTSIGSNTFYNCSSLTSITIPDGVTSIGSNTFYNCSGISSITIPESVINIGESAFDGCKLETVLAKNPLTTLLYFGVSNDQICAFSDRTLQHAMLYIPLGTWRKAVYEGDWYLFNNIREVTTNSQSLSPAKAYTMMRAQDYKYAVCNMADNNVNIVNAFYSIDEADPNSSWQIIDQPGGKAVMNIGSGKYLNVLADGKMALSDSPVILNVSDNENGITINGTDCEWMFVTNNNVNVKSVDNPTKVADLKDNSISSGEYYSIDGVKLSEPRNGLSIIRTQDGTVKKVIK